jgi:hypothetical protein
VVNLGQWQKAVLLASDIWSYEGFLAKARTYFAKAEDHPKADDAILAVWLLLGLEFLLRAPLARANPVLLADAAGDAVMHAAGFPGPPGSPEPKSVTIRTVIQRLGRVVENFDQDRQGDATFLTNLRNQEFHTAETLTIPSSRWLPHFMRVVDTIAVHLSIHAEDVVGPTLTVHGRALVDAEDKRIISDVRRRIATCQEFFKRLHREEVESRRRNVPNKFGSYTPLWELPDDPTTAAGESWWRIVNETGAEPEMTPCPACSERAAVKLQHVRSTSERIEDDLLVADSVYVAVGFICIVCGLELSSTAEVRAAGIEVQYTRQEGATLEERFSSLQGTGEG